MKAAEYTVFYMNNLNDFHNSLGGPQRSNHTRRSHKNARTCHPTQPQTVTRFIFPFDDYEINAFVK